MFRNKEKYELYESKRENVKELKVIQKTKTHGK